VIPLRCAGQSNQRSLTTQQLSTSTRLFSHLNLSRCTPPFVQPQFSSIAMNEVHGF
jgi:hypothetical protein